MTSDEFMDKELELSLSRNLSIVLFTLNRRTLEMIREGRTGVPSYVVMIIRLFETLHPFERDKLIYNLQIESDAKYNNADSKKSSR